MLMGSVAAGLIAGVTFAATTLVEVHARCGDPTLGRAAVAGLAATAIAFVAALLAVLQVPYTIAAIETQSTSAALEAVEEGWRELGRRPVMWSSIAGMIAPIFGMSTFARVRRLEFEGRSVIAVLTVVPCLPGCVVLAMGPSNTAELFQPLAGCLVVVPIVHELADALERRLRRRSTAT
jgi:hypothetical protein